MKLLEILRDFKGDHKGGPAFQEYLGQFQVFLRGFGGNSQGVQGDPGEIQGCRGRLSSSDITAVSSRIP